MKIIGHIKDAKVPRKPSNSWEQNVLSYETPFGKMFVSRGWHNKIRWYLGPITIQSYKGEVHNTGSLWIGRLDTELFLSLTPKIRKRKSEAQCPGLDLRPLQQDYRRQLGDLERFNFLLRRMRGIGLNHMVQHSFDVPAARLTLKNLYEYEKQRKIEQFIRSQEHAKDSVS